MAVQPSYKMRERQPSVCGFIKSSINRIFRGFSLSNSKKLPREYQKRIYGDPANLRPPNQDEDRSDILETTVPIQQNNSLSWQPGYQLKNGDYTIERELGRGGFGITYLAQDRRGDRVNNAIIHGMNLSGRDRPRRIQLFLR